MIGQGITSSFGSARVSYDGIMEGMSGECRR